MDEMKITTNGITITMNHDQPVVSSLQVADSFGKQHKHVLRDIGQYISNGTKIGLVENMFYQTTYLDGHNQERPMYLMNRDGFSLLVMGFTGSDALEWKLKYIQAFNVMEQKLNSPEYIMKRALTMADEKIKQLESKIESDKPKVQFAEAITDSKDCILVGELAKVLKANGIDIGQNRLYEQLRTDGYLMTKGHQYNQPTQKSMNLGLMKIKRCTIMTGYGTKVVTTTMITGKGQQYFINHYVKNMNEQELERV